MKCQQVSKYIRYFMWIYCNVFKAMKSNMRTSIIKGLYSTKYVLYVIVYMRVRLHTYVK